MDKLVEFYNQIGISPAVYQYGEKTLDSLKERFEAIDKIAEFNQAKVLCAMQKNRVLSGHRACKRLAYGSRARLFEHGLCA